MCILNNFSRSIFLILDYQLTFLQSGRFPGKMNWTGSWECIQCSWSSKSISRLKYAQAQCFFIKYWSAFFKYTSIFYEKTFMKRRFYERLAAWMSWILIWGISASSTPAASQSCSSCREIDHFRETATGTETTLPKFVNKLFFSRISVVLSELYKLSVAYRMAWQFKSVNKKNI